jgi:predicted GTPase
MQPRGNGKIKKVTDDLKKIIVRKNRNHPATSLPKLLQRAVKIHNRTPRSNGYFPYFLLYGTQPSDQHLQFETYVREPTNKKNDKFQRELAKHHEAPIARNNATGVKALRNQIRAYLQKGKALLRVYAPGN